MFKYNIWKSIVLVVSLVVLAFDLGLFCGRQWGKDTTVGIVYEKDSDTGVSVLLSYGDDIAYTRCGITYILKDDIVYQVNYSTMTYTRLDRHVNIPDVTEFLSDTDCSIVAHRATDDELRCFDLLQYSVVWHC